MSPARNWLSFAAPPIEMLVSDPFYFAGAGEPPAVKLEDFLGGQRSSPFGSNLSCYDPPEFSSPLMASGQLPLSSGDLEDSSSATENNYLCSAAHCTDSDLALSHLQPPLTEETALVTTPATRPLVSCQRTSIYRGVTRHRWTGRFEAHLWDNTCRREGLKRKGRQVYLGGYDNEDRAAMAYDLAALKYWGLSATTNFPVKNYYKEMEEMQIMTKQEFIASLRRKSSGFSRGASIYRGVTRHHQHGRWQARIGRVAGNKDLYLGTFGTEEEAAEAYDVAAIKFRGSNAVTNFELNRYNLEAIANSDLPIGAAARKMKLTLQACNNSIRSSSTSLPSNCHNPSTLIENLLQLQCGSPPEPAPYHYYSFLSGGGGFAEQSLYWLGPNAESCDPMNTGEFLQLMRSASSSSQ